MSDRSSGTSTDGDAVMFVATALSFAAVLAQIFEFFVPWPNEPMTLGASARKVFDYLWALWSFVVVLRLTQRWQRKRIA